MHAKWTLTATAILLATPVAYADPPIAYILPEVPLLSGIGLAALVAFDRDSASFLEGPGWDCDFAYTPGDIARVVSDCIPVEEPHACSDPMVAVGATPVSTGYVEGAVSCGGLEATCYVPVLVAGHCTAHLPGTRQGHLVCIAETNIASLGGTGYAICGNGR